MADQADVYIKNMFAEGISAIRKLPDGSCDLELTISSGDEQLIYLGGADTSLVINAPSGVDIINCLFTARTGIDLVVLCSRTDSNWKIKIIPNDLPPDSPTTVLITIGGGGE